MSAFDWPEQFGQGRPYDCCPRNLAVGGWIGEGRLSTQPGHSLAACWSSKSAAENSDDPPAEVHQISGIQPSKLLRALPAIAEASPPASKIRAIPIG